MARKRGLKAKEIPGYPLWADKPLEDPKDDALNYAHFASQLAQLVETMPSDGLVVGIRGDWGLGKSTVLNFVEHYLNQPATGNRPIVVPFNPWWFSGREDLTLQFFNSLQRALDEEKEEFDELKESLRQFAGVVSRLPIPWVKGVAEAGQKLLELKQDSVLKLKEKISAEPLKRKERIVVVVDDIDRLASREIAELFAVIRSVADFPYTYYFLAFDWDVVVSALNGMQGEDGEDYLEKIVQLPTAVPRPTRTALHGFFGNKLESVIKDTRPELKETQSRGAALLAHAVDFIDTPRDAIRLANSVAALYGQVKDEALVPDYVAANALNVFCPLAFDMVARNPEKFEVLAKVEGNLKADLVQFHSRWLKWIREKDKGCLIRLLSAMYQQLQPVFEEIEHGKS